MGSFHKIIRRAQIFVERAFFGEQVGAFRDAVVFGKVPHADDRHKPLTECISKAAPNEMGGMSISFRKRCPVLIS